MTKQQDLQDQIEQLRWELSSGAFAGSTDEELSSIHSHLMDLEEQYCELLAKEV